MKTTEPAVLASGVTKRYASGAVALRDVSLRIDHGEMVGLLGPSGSGKTTLLRLVNAALWPSEGTMRVLGVDTAQLRGSALRSFRRRVAIVAQQHSLIPRVSAAHNILLGQAGRVPLWRMLWSTVAPQRAERTAVFGLLAELGLGAALDQPVDSLSGGQQQRVAVARSLYQGGDLFIADEPVASVDQETAEQILSVLRRLAREEGKTVLVSLHQRALAAAYCSRLVTLEQGRIVYDGPASADAWQRTAETLAERTETLPFEDRLPLQGALQ